MKTKNTAIIVLQKVPLSCPTLAVRNSVSVSPGISWSKHCCPIASDFLSFRTFLLLPVPTQQPYVIYTQYQVNVLYNPAFSLTTNIAETMQHEEVAGASPIGIVGTLRTPYLDSRSACQHNVWSVWTDPFCSLLVLSDNSYNCLSPKNIAISNWVISCNVHWTLMHH